MAERVDGIETREQMLDAACALFGEHGFDRVTINMICASCGANVSAVSYHFGSKKGLYTAAWREAFDRANQMFPVNGGLSARALPDEKLKAVVEALLNRMLNHAALGFAGQLLLRELSGPGVIDPEVRQQIIDPIRRHVRSVVRENVGSAVDEERVSWLAFSVVSQCLSFGMRGGRMPMAFVGRAVDEQFISELRDHIVAFSLHGMHGFSHAVDSAANPGLTDKQRKRVLSA